MTHPNDLVARAMPPASACCSTASPPATSRWRWPGGIRYRDQLQEMSFTTDADGKFRSVKRPAPGMYWMEAEGPRRQGRDQGGQDARASYAATVEVLLPQ
ncbi:hypothetical protein ACU4GD_13545 [Cupriavidus basilensis]